MSKTSKATLSVFPGYERQSSKSAAVRARLDYPVIDTDLHTVEFTPLLEDYIDKIGGPAIVDQFRAAILKGFAYLSNDWYTQSQEQRRTNRAVRPPWWVLPTKNTLDLATVSLPKLLHERLAESGTDFAVLYPNVTTFAVHIGNAELRRAVVRAVNTYHADVYREYADRLTPVAAIPLYTPQEGIEELEFAVKELGLKTVLIPGSLQRPIKTLAGKYPRAEFSDLAPHLTWLDTFGLDSEYDYDPFWAKCAELKVSPTTHSAGMGWTSRSSVSNYMYNHLGHFASASEALAKSLFFSGVTQRFPTLKFGFLEGGVAWGANLYADLVAHWEKRNKQTVHNYNPELIDRKLLHNLYVSYGGKEIQERLGKIETSFGGVLGISSSSRHHAQDPSLLDDFASAGIERAEDIVRRFVPNFYFGVETDDVTVAHAFNTKVNPFGARLNALRGSDSGHWDVPDLTQVLAETWSLVEHEVLSEQDFRDLVFSNPARFYAENNPVFFKETAVEDKVQKQLAA